ncbi:MAG: HAD family hydrolase [Patescibacteria group bacterium]
MLKLIAFDFDGVLAQGSNQAYFACYHQALVKVGIQLDPAVEKARILERWGQSIEQQVELLVKDDPSKLDAAMQSFKAAIQTPAFRAQVALFPQVDTLLRTLSQDYKLSIVSGAEMALIEDVLGPELTALFSSIHSADSVTAALRKPSPYMLERAMQIAGASAHETIYLGDAQNDLRTALAAQVVPVAVLTGYLTRAQAQALGTEYILNDLTELPALLLNLNP